MLYREDYRRLLRAGGLAVWLAVGLPVAALQLIAPPNSRDAFALAAWFAALLLYGAAFWLATRRGARRSGAVLLIAGETAAVLALVALPPCFGLRGPPLVPPGLPPGPDPPPPAATVLVPAQGGGVLRLMWLHWGWHWGVVLAFAYLPFQFIADATARLLAEETALRQTLAA